MEYGGRLERICWLEFFLLWLILMINVEPRWHRAVDIKKQACAYYTPCLPFGQTEEEITNHILLLLV